MTRLLTALLFLLTSATASASDAWILVDTQRQEIRVFEDGYEALHLPRIAIGRGGVSELRQRGDRTTPLGEFRVAWINEDSDFHLFFGLDFPHFSHARMAYNQGLMEQEEFFSIIDAVRDRRLPPQRTALGGHIGIHGIGNGDRDLHNRANWTQGCVAVTNEEMDKLAEFVDVGTRVVITAEKDITALIPSYER
ncbi:L,D-transpeptidase family protein [Aquisalimonas asiatica]|uniref:L,D-transpeptidase catalytic domain n=1 Tax=Aquisalimonas asiatica TaxID=406100 RepID=A0A1H8QG81_9GAMM|nr:L,D-transpeptidase [Aquisalimonas asiatica]SEO53212.1 L,D-transpeptidase catalytic domain [Aquisalimonas asiatica]